MKKEWFEQWFDSPYYHALYKSRDEKEAQNTLDNLLHALQLPPGARILDLACGKGRHSRYLAEKNYDVTGLDISSASIEFARQFEHEGLSFYQHDMRLLFRINYFDAVMNMFTSFGYFKSDRDHLLSLKNVRRGLKPGGLFLLDYFNAEWVRQNLVRTDIKTVDGIEFHLKRNIRDGYVFKSVEFAAEGRKFHFQERVRLFTRADFESLLTAAGLALRRAYGSYDLNDFDKNNSRRLIIIAQKPVTL
ncbi:MAG TPA: class I SAM-dependent methyltransferase [Saprospiraceae bacterium]|nr:class I SAM-dependent methyltransferase [Saprospiraceae bacterium]